jgi:heme-degrading monooxygenase HmoA
MQEGFARTPAPPYYAVIFTSRRTPGDHGYAAMADVMEELARRQPGFLGIDSARSPDGFGITTAYFSDAASILAWKDNTEHLQAQKLGRDLWYEHYEVRVAKVERAYSGR